MNTFLNASYKMRYILQRMMAVNYLKVPLVTYVHIFHSNYFSEHSHVKHKCIISTSNLKDVAIVYFCNIFYFEYSMNIVYDVANQFHFTDAIEIGQGCRGVVELLRNGCTIYLFISYGF